jgi:CBS domain-containing protein
MKISDLMQQNVQVVTVDATMRDAARRMSTSCVGALPVCSGDRIVGIITDRDIVVRALARGDDPDHAHVPDAMTREVEFCFDDDEVDEASRKMCERQIQRLLVMNHEKRLVGILSIADLVRAGAAAPAASRALGEIKAPTKPSAAGLDAQHLGH